MMQREEKIRKLISVVEGLVKKNVVERKVAVDNFFEKYMDRFATAPASSKLEYHEAYPGGLIEHSLIVYKYLKKIIGSICPEKYSEETLLICALFHDVGKIGDSKEDNYIPETSDWHRNNLGRMYQINNKCLPMHHSRRTMFILQDIGLQLSEEEFQAILYHDGQGLEANSDVRMKEYDLTLLLSFADRWSVQYSVNKNKE